MKNRANANSLSTSFLKNRTTDECANLDHINIEYLREKSRFLKSRIIRAVEEFGDYNKIKSDRQIIMSLIQHDNPEIRWAALQIFGEEIANREEYVQMCIKRIRLDESDIVRISCISRVGHYYSNSSNSDILKMLYNLIIDKSISNDLRKFAFFSFELVVNRVTLHKDEFLVDDDVDLDKLGDFMKNL